MMMRSTLTIAAGLLAASAVGCSTPSADAPAAAQSSDISEAEAHASAIVWTQAEDKVTQYIDEQGHVVSHRIGLELAIGPAVLRLKTSRSDAVLPCSFDYGNGAQESNGKYAGFGLSLASSSGLPEQVMVPLVPMPADNEYAAIDQGADITGSVGPFVFVRESVYEMGCGAAHPGSTVNAFVWNAARGATAAIGTYASDAVTAKAREALAGKGFDAVAPAVDSIKLVEVIPRFDAGAHLTLAYRFEKDACYACSDHQGSDYTISAVVEGADAGAPLPPELAAYADSPAAVTAYLAANPGVTINGWSPITR